MRKFRYIEPGHGVDSLTQYEIELLDTDLDISTKGYYILVPLDKAEWSIVNIKSDKKDKG